MGFKQKIKYLLRVSQHIMLILQVRKFILAPKLILLYVLVEKTQRVSNMLQKLHQGQNCQASNRLNFYSIEDRPLFSTLSIFTDTAFESARPIG
jgi:hypothetical protein